MSDLIVGCQRFKNPDDSVRSYSVTYDFDLPNPQSVTISIDASEMTDSSSLSELMEIANIKAAGAKVYLGKVDGITDVIGEVTL